MTETLKRGDVALSLRNGTIVFKDVFVEDAYSDSGNPAFVVLTRVVGADDATAMKTVVGKFLWGEVIGWRFVE